MQTDFMEKSGNYSESDLILGNSGPDVRPSVTEEIRKSTV